MSDTSEGAVEEFATIRWTVEDRRGNGRPNNTWISMRDNDGGIIDGEWNNEEFSELLAAMLKEAKRIGIEVVRTRESWEDELLGGK